MGLAPLLVEQSFEIIKQVNDAGVAMLDRRAERQRLAQRSPTAATSSRPGELVLEGKAAELAEDEDLRKAYLEVARATLPP